MKRDKIVNNLTERLCSNAKSAVPIVDVFCLQAKLLLGRYNLYGNSLEIQVKYTIEKYQVDWKPWANLTFGGRERVYASSHLHGMITDAQVNFVGPSNT